MKNFPNKVFHWAIVYLLLGEGLAFAQPIQLIPQNLQAPSPLPSATSETTGFWEGTPPTIIETYLPKIPINLTSPALRTLRSKVLKEPYSPLLQTPSYEKTLLSLLIDTGSFEEAKELILETNHPEKEAVLLNLQWLMGDIQKACEKIANLIRTSHSFEWKQQNVYCHYINGEEERGKIVLELLKDTHPETNVLLDALFNPSLTPSFEAFIGQSPFFLRVWGALKQEIPENMLKDLPPSYLALIANMETLPLKTRLLAGEQALQQGTLMGEAILKMLKDAPSEHFLKKVEAALNSQKPEELASLLKIALHEHSLGLIGKVFNPTLTKLKPSPETLILAPYLIRVFLETGETNHAQQWGLFFMREAPEEAISVLPLLHLASPQIKWTNTQVHAWNAYQERENPKLAAQNVYGLKRILEALGESTQGEKLDEEPLSLSWRQERKLFDEQSLNLLKAATNSQRKGEVLLLALSLIGQSSLSGQSPDKLSPTIEALQNVGYAAEARSLALDFLLANGF